MQVEKPVVIILTAGKADNGKQATLAFSCALSATSLGQPTTVFLTSDGAVWGYRGSAQGITVQGFEGLETIMEQFRDAGGRVLLCSVCHRTCGAGGPDQSLGLELLPNVQIAGFTAMLETAIQGISISF